MRELNSKKMSGFWPETMEDAFVLNCFNLSLWYLKQFNNESLNKVYIELKDALLQFVEMDLQEKDSSTVLEATFDDHANRQ